MVDIWDIKKNQIFITTNFSHNDIGEIKIHDYRKRQMSDKSWEFLKIENKQIKTVPNNSCG